MPEVRTGASSRDQTGITRAMARVNIPTRSAAHDDSVDAGWHFLPSCPSLPVLFYCPVSALSAPFSSSLFSSFLDSFFLLSFPFSLFSPSVYFLLSMPFFSPLARCLLCPFSSLPPSSLIFSCLILPLSCHSLSTPSFHSLPFLSLLLVPCLLLLFPHLPLLCLCLLL